MAKSRGSTCKEEVRWDHPQSRAGNNFGVRLLSNDLLDAGSCMKVRSARSMSPPSLSRLLPVAVVLGICSTARSTELSFNRDIRPILSDKCYSCHGPDKRARKAERGWTRRRERSRNTRALGRSCPRSVKSDLIVRIESHDPDEVMPHRKAKGSSLPRRSPRSAMVAQGGKYEPHWSLIPPRRPMAPESGVGGQKSDRIRSMRHSRASGEGGAGGFGGADRTTLIRRVTYDLTGLPPTPAEIDAFSRMSRPVPTTGWWIVCSPRPGMGKIWRWLARSVPVCGYARGTS